MQTHAKSGVYFKDGVRKVDFVFVIGENFKNHDTINYVIGFFHFLQQHGIHLELFQRSSESHIFIKMHLPDPAIAHFANLYGIDLMNSGHFAVPFERITMKRFQSELSKDQHDYFLRNRNEVTSMERILIAYQILQEVIFHDAPTMYGMEKLTKLGGFIDTYPMHDGEYDSEENNDRQILFKHWASLSNWYKEQPLNLIQKYYGSEVAFYFAFVGFYNRMLIPAAVVGLLCFLFSLIQLAYNQPIIEETCNSNKMMCPVCPTAKLCIKRFLNASCSYTIASSVFDNRATVFFAVFMSFWATIFINLWRRFECVLRVRWNIDIDETDTKLRLAYLEKAKKMVYSPVTHRWEPQIERFTIIKTYIFTYTVFISLILIVVFVVLSIVIYRISLNGAIKMSGNKHLINHMTLFSMTSGAFLQVMFIRIFGLFYTPISEWLTRIENPRTQTEFDNSVVHKRYVLAFINNYMPLFYMAFFKGRFYIPNHKRLIFSFETDVCHTCGCLLALCIQLGFVMVLKSFIGNMITFILPFIKKKCKKIKNKPQSHLTTWEREFELKKAGRFLLTSEFTEMIIQYGFVTFFVAAFSLGPLCALLNNILELRLDAYKLVARYRRVIPKKKTGIGPWNGLLTTITLIGFATNGFVLAFTSDFVPREVYNAETGTLKNYVNSTLSIFDMDDFEYTHKLSNETSHWCYYRAHRYPPDHPHKYQFTTKYYFDVALRIACVLIFEHLLYILNGLLSNFISDMPEVVKETLNWKHTKERELRLESRRLN